MPKFKVGDKVKAIPAIAEISAPKMKGRVWTVTAVVAGGRRVDLESNGEKLSGILGTALTAANSAAANAAYSDALKIIMDSVKGYMDRRIKGDDAWKYPNFVITILRKVCDTATMSAGRYDGKRPPHRIYNVECTLRGYKFQGSLICTGLLHRDDPDDVSAFDEYDMTLSLMNVGKVSISRNSVVANALAWKQGGEVAKNADDHARVRVVAETETLFGKKREEKTMTVGELRAAMTRLGHGRLFADVVRDAEAGKDANPLLKLPCEAWITLA